MKTRALRQFGVLGLCWPERWPFSFAVMVTWSIALVLLGAATAAILEFRSPKYLVALIVVAAGAAAYLMIPHKHYYLVFAVGFSLPYVAEIILMRRDKTLSITGTFLLALTLALVCLATRKIRQERIVLVPAISIPALLLMASGLLSLTNTSDKTDTLIALAQTMEMLLLFLILVNSIREVKYLEGFLQGLYLGFAVQCCIYVIQNIVGFSFDIVGNITHEGTTDLGAGLIGSHEGTISSQATAGLYFSVFTMFLVGSFLCRRRLPLRLNPLLGMVMGTGCLILAAKRAPLSGFAIGMVLMSLLITRHSAQAKKRLFGIVAVMAIPVLALLPILLLRAEVDHLIDFDERKNLTRVAFNMYHAYPIFGVGLGTYDVVKRDYLPKDWNGWLYTVHNQYLIVLAESGIVGLSAFILLFLMILATAYWGIQVIDPTYRPLQIALFCGLVAVLWEMQWDTFDDRPQGYITWFLISLSVILPRVLVKVPRSEAA